MAGLSRWIDVRSTSAVAAFAVAILYPQQPAQARMNIDELSLMTTPVLLFDGTKQISLGTGFFFASSDTNGKLQIPFLVTNYHVLTGYSPGEKGPKKGDRIQFFLHTSREKPESIKRVEFPVYTTKGDPTWITHPNEPVG